jgi:hypothetical protein
MAETSVREVTRNDPSRWLIYRDRQHSGWWIVEYCVWGTGDGFIGRARSRKEAIAKMNREINSEIQGSPKRYTHQQYGMSVTTARDWSRARYFKKSWVPRWLFKWFAEVDALDLMERKMAEAKDAREKELHGRISKP